MPFTTSGAAGEKRAKSEKLSMSVASTPTVSPTAANVWYHCSPVESCSSPPPRVQEMSEARLPQHPAGEHDHDRPDRRAGEALEVAHGLHALADDDHLDAPQDQEGDPAQQVHPEEPDLGERLHAGDDPHEQHLQGERREEGLDAVPGDRHDPPDERREPGPPDAPAQPADDGVGRAGVVTHEPGHAAAAEDDERAAEDAERDLDGAEAEQEQPRGEGVVADVVRVVHPQGEEAVGVPVPLLRRRRPEVVVVEPARRVLRGERRLVDLGGCRRSARVPCGLSGFERGGGGACSGQPSTSFGRGGA